MKTKRKLNTKTLKRLPITANLIASMAFIVGLTGSPSSQAATIQGTSSSVAILTDKEGLAAALAHRHIIVATNIESSLDLGAVDLAASDALSKISSGQAKVSFKVQDLVVDTNSAAASIIPVFSNAKLWVVGTDKLEEGNASTVKENMLDSSQLDAGKFATIEGQGRFDSCVTKADALECKLSLTLIVKGKSIAKQLPLTIKKSGQSAVAEFLGSFKFTDFGIKPYTAMFGAIAVKDQFYVAGRITASN
ncbi:MAG: hypothetical protein NT027_11340 [Proteobacteria bacterium]|nr:hypothetical protein [Pseudomonadota bacterium]